tara:strand:- start:207 stop:374 length:168 start_codon:yes stop_codon:yes gene_type:complete
MANTQENKQASDRTLREHFAGLAMQALINDSVLEPLEVAVIALEYADALLAELDK